MHSLPDLLFDTALWVATLRIATPLILGTLGELLCERVGVVNLAIEGIMTLGAFIGWFVVMQGAPLWVGVSAAAAAGMALGAVHAVLTVIFGLAQHVVGIGLTLFGVGSSSFLFRMFVPAVGAPKIDSFTPMAPTLLHGIPIVGPVLAQQTSLFFVALLFVAMVGYFLYQTPSGLAARMVGESPEAAAAQGISVVSVRMVLVIAGSGLMGIAGSFLSLAAFNSFVVNLVGGRGWICIALVVFSSWRPGRLLIGALFFGLVDALQLRLQQMVPNLPYQVFLMLPYVLSLVVLIGLSRQSRSPQALMVPYFKGLR